MAKEIFINSKKLLDSQLEADGKQPLELVRTNAKSYSTFNLRAWFMLASLAENQGIDLWHYQTNKGASIQKALDFMIPFVKGEKNGNTSRLVHTKQTILPSCSTGLQKNSIKKIQGDCRNDESKSSTTWKNIVHQLKEK